MGSHIGQGATLDRGSALSAASGRVILELQADGNLVLTHDGATVWDVWASAGPVDGQQLRVETTGGMTLRAPDGATVVWATPAAVNPYPRELCLRDDGSLVLLALNPLWATNTVDVDAVLSEEPAVLVAGEALPPGGRLRVASYKAEVTASGQLEVSHSDVVVWSSAIPQPGAGSYLAVAPPTWPAAVYAGLCVKSDAGAPTWIAPVPLNADAGAQDRFELRLQSDGNLVLYACKELWRAAGVRPLPPRSLRRIMRAAVADETLSDGSRAVTSIDPLTDLDGRPLEGDRPLVLVMAASDTLRPVANAPTLQAALVRYRNDLVADGFDARVLAVDCYKGPLHEDGRIVLALRKTLQALRGECPRLQGVLLVGAYPEATIVRRWLWDTQYESPAVKLGVPEGQHYVQCWPEPVANWSDIVLADLTGSWEHLYRASTKITAFKGIASGNPEYRDGEVFQFTQGNYLHKSLDFQDVFVVLEDQFDFSVDAGTGVASVTCHLDRRNPEVFEPSRAQANPIARPDIIVSRIDAHGAAYSVDASRVDATGRHYVDAQGRPQTVGDDIDLAPPTTAEQLLPDADLERRLLLEYFDRNHAHRATPAKADRVVSTSSSDFSGQAAVHAQDLSGVVGTAQPPVVFGGADLDAYARSWDLPTSIRAFHAHSSGVNSSFPGQYVAAALEQFVGQPMYRWHHDPATRSYVPGIEGQGEWADFWLHRSMWQTRPTATTSSLVVHYGCDTPSSAGTATLPYSHPQFAACRLASCLLFYTDALLMFGRTKVYLDAPVSFLEPLRNGGTAGDAWVRLYDEAGDNDRLGEFAHWVDAKIAYSWALVGDWTLKRRY